VGSDEIPAINEWRKGYMTENSARGYRVISVRVRASAAPCLMRLAGLEEERTRKPAGKIPTSLRARNLDRSTSVPAAAFVVELLECATLVVVAATVVLVELLDREAL
jgi:hypothetical protein